MKGAKKIIVAAQKPRSETYYASLLETLSASTIRKMNIVLGEIADQISMQPDVANAFLEIPTSRFAEGGIAILDVKNILLKFSDDVAYLILPPLPNGLNKSVFLIAPPLDEPLSSNFKNFRAAIKGKIAKLPVVKDDPKKNHLDSYKISFNDSTSTIRIGATNVKLPPGTNMHNLCRVMFRNPNEKPISWDEVYEEMTKSDILSKGSMRSVRDAMYAVNKLVKSTINTDDELFSWQQKTITRNY